MNSLIRLVTFVGFVLSFLGQAWSQNCFSEVTQNCEVGVDVSCAQNTCAWWSRNPTTGIWQPGNHDDWESDIRCGVNVQFEKHFTNAQNIPVVVPYFGEFGNPPLPNGIVNCKLQGSCLCTEPEDVGENCPVGSLVWVDKIYSEIVDTTTSCVEN